MACLLPVVLIITVGLVSEANGAKILSISFMSSKSHKIVYEPLLHKLAERGHSVTVVSPINSEKKMPNLRNILTIAPETIEKELNFPNLFEMRAAGKGFASGFMSPFLILGPFLDKVCRLSYDLPHVQEIMKEKFDLIMFTPFFNDCLYGLIHKMNTTTILISQVSVFPWLADTMGTPSPPSIVPFAFFGFNDKMTYFERVINMLGVLTNWFAKSIVYDPKMEALYREVIDPNSPSIKEIERNASIILCNSHLSFTRPRPLLPDIINVGGLHLTPAKPVSKELDEFLSGNGDEGFIYFSMGSALKAHTMPEEYRKVFLQTFAKLKQRVLWKWETETMDDLPKNVKLSKWLPQQDVLGHKNIRLFITHGGHGSTQEAIYHGVPLVGIPMFGDQTANMQEAKRLGFALPLEFTELSVDVLTNAINTVISDSSYPKKARELSDLFHDQIDKPLDRAVYWTEYVLRHKGARHLRSAARDLNNLQYHSIDVIAFLLAVLLLSLYLSFVVLRALLRKCCGSKSTSSKKSSTKKRQ